MNPEMGMKDLWGMDGGVEKETEKKGLQKREVYFLCNTLYLCGSSLELYL
jgi:hypothetical protein